MEHNVPISVVRESVTLDLDPWEFPVELWETIFSTPFVMGMREPDQFFGEYIGHHKSADWIVDKDDYTRYTTIRLDKAAYLIKSVDVYHDHVDNEVKIKMDIEWLTTHYGQYAMEAYHRAPTIHDFKPRLVNNIHSDPVLITVDLMIGER